MIENAKVELRKFLEESEKSLNEKVDSLLDKLFDKIKLEIRADPKADSWTAKVECIDLLSEKQNGHYLKLSQQTVLNILKERGYRVEIVKDSNKIELTIFEEDLT